MQKGRVSEISSLIPKPCTKPSFMSGSLCFLSSRPANVCITSVPRMDRVLSSGWTGSKAVSLMLDAYGLLKLIKTKRAWILPWVADESFQAMRFSCPVLAGPLIQQLLSASLSGCVKQLQALTYIALNYSNRDLVIRIRRMLPEPTVFCVLSTQQPWPPSEVLCSPRP